MDKMRLIVQIMIHEMIKFEAKFKHTIIVGTSLSIKT